MKTLLSINLILLLLQGCSYDNAFSRFDISQERAKSEESIVSSKIYSQNNVIGLLNCVYLNTVMPNKYTQDEYFYVSIYTKNTDVEPHFTLNDRNASSVKALDVKNEFSKLTASDVDWQKYYLVSFEKQGEQLVFKASLSTFSSDPIKFTKDE